MFFLKKIIRLFHYSLYLFPISDKNMHSSFHPKIITIALDNKYQIPDECLHLTTSRHSKIFYLDYTIDKTFFENSQINPSSFHFYQYSKWKKWHSNPSLTTQDFLKYSSSLQKTFQTLIDYGLKQNDPIYILLPYFWFSPDLIQKYNRKDIIFLISPLQKYGDYKYISEYDILKKNL